MAYDNSGERRDTRISFPSIKSGGLLTVAAFITFVPGRRDGDGKPTDYKLSSAKEKILVNGGGFISFGAMWAIIRGLKRESSPRYTSENVLLQGSRMTRAVDFDRSVTEFSVEAEISFKDYDGTPRVVQVHLNNDVIQELTALMIRVKAEEVQCPGYEAICTRGLVVNTYDDDD